MKNRTHTQVAHGILAVPRGLAAATIALLGAITTNAQQTWTVSLSPDRIITHPSGWAFNVMLSGTSITVRKCVSTPSSAGVLPFADPVDGDYTITSIAPSANTGILESTQNRNKATSLTLPDTLVTIGSWAFRYCSATTGSLVIPDSVTTIGIYAFEGCSGFTGSLAIPDAVTTIGDYAFHSCSGFTGSLTIGNSVKTIGDDAFDACSGFTGSLTIPDSVTGIGRYAFRDTRFTQIYSPSTGVTIGTYAFGSNPSLTVVYYSGGYPTAGANLYSGSNNATSYVVTAYATLWDDSVTPQGGLSAGNPATTWQSRPIRVDNWTYASSPTPSITHPGGWAFHVSVNGTELTVTNCIASPTSAGVLPFAQPVNDGYTIVGVASESRVGGVLGAHRDKAHSLTLPDTLKTVGNYAFQSCTNLTGALAFPAAVTAIGNYAFYSCTGLSDSLVLPAAVTNIGDYAFYSCTGLTGSPALGNALETIGGGAFYSCTGFTGDLAFPDTVTAIGNSAFHSCSNLTGSLTFGNALKTIDNYAFYCCSGLTGELTLPDTVTSIGNSAFSVCSNLTGSLTFGDALVTIGDYAFSPCPGLTGDLTLPDTVTAIGNFAFSNTRFTRVYTPSTEVTIGNCAFGNNPSLTGVYYSGDYPAVGTDIYVQSFNVTSYVAAAHVQSWDPHVTPPNTLSTTGAATWQSRPIRCSTLVVSFDGNGATNGPFPDQAALPGEPYGALPEATKPGYTAAWTLDGATVTAATTVTATTNHTLVAQWTTNTYKLMFAPGDASFYNHNPPGYTQDVTYDTPTALLPNEFVYPGHTFAGWLCAADNQIYKDGATVLNLATSGRVGMVAQWAPIGFLGEGVLIGSITVDIGGDVTLTWPPVKCNAYAVYVTDDLAAPPEAWAEFVEDVEMNLYITRDPFGILDSAMLPLKLFKGADLNTDRLFFVVRMLN